MSIVPVSTTTDGHPSVISRRLLLGGIGGATLMALTGLAFADPAEAAEPIYAQWTDADGTTHVEDYYLMDKDGALSTGATQTCAIAELHRKDSNKNQYRVGVDLNTKKKYKIRLRTYAYDARGHVVMLADKTVKARHKGYLRGYAPRGGQLVVIAEAWITVKRKGKKKKVKFTRKFTQGYKK